MGYVVEDKDCDFFIKKENIHNAHQALCCYSKTKTEIKEYLKWIDLDEIIYSKTLEEALEICDFEIVYDEDGNICDIGWIGECLGDHDDILSVIAPYVEEDSYIHMYGDDGEHWRWCFKDNRCYIKTPKLVWE